MICCVKTLNGNQPLLYSSVVKFEQRKLPPGQLVRSDALASLVEIGKTQHHAARVAPLDKAGKWLPWVYIAIGNLKAFLLGTLSRGIVQVSARVSQ